MNQGDRVYRFHRGSKGTILWATRSHIGVRWDDTREVYGYRIVGEGIEPLSPLEQLAEVGE